ncbi:MAG: NADH dehydrogenase FAD-containing subunit [Cellvibrionaceae bacterium]|jgi:NADH dehydrogenase FAD-containing subunit
MPMITLFVLSIAVIGAGTTYVKLAAELHCAFPQYNRLGLDEIQSTNIHITVIEAGPRILSLYKRRLLFRQARNYVVLALNCWGMKRSLKL